MAGGAMIQREASYLRSKAGTFAVVTSLIIVAVAALLAAVFYLPPLLAPDPPPGLPLDQQERFNRTLELRNDVRSTLLQIVGIPLLVLSAVATWRQLTSARREFEQQLEMNRQSQLAERFSRAIELLGSESTNVRLGAIHALSAISNESDQYRPAVAATLTAYIRYHSPWPLKEPDELQLQATSRPSLRDNPAWRLRSRKPDVQAALDVIIKLNSGYPLDRKVQVNLNATDLRLAHLERADLTNASLRGSSLEGAWMRGADLTGAWLDGADCGGANLDEAILEGVRVDENTQLLDAENLNSTRGLPHGIQLQRALGENRDAR
jgi:hypothetical protein